jgi:hypothetical protein
MTKKLAKKPTTEDPPKYTGPRMVLVDNGSADLRTSEEDLKTLCGSDSPEFQTNLVSQAIGSVWLTNKESNAAVEGQTTAVLTSMMGIAPRDEIEGMLAAQMVGIHNASMECLKRAMLPEQPADYRSANLNQAAKLTRTYVAQMEALNRHRGKGQQKVTVEHVNVHQGGQAIVGSVTQREGVTKKKERQPHAKQITDAPGTPLPCQDETENVVPIASNAKR